MVESSNTKSAHHMSPTILLSMTYTTHPNYHLSNLERRETIWYLSAGKTIMLVQGWSVPLAEIHALGLSAYSEVYLTSNGYWCASYPEAVAALKAKHHSTLSVKGNCLSMFIHEEWAEDNGNPHPHHTYRLTRNLSSWECEPISC